ncbi:MAG: hypothetical protein L6Q37_05005 [Bdellovibrionaceae bacterium]|nr:hypothetical protein [Pseudobdellovibrionaceae bacterium]NUM58017.1 hypothetical protein [Pseudobdellovibrionaceae bacterium]
MKISIKKFNTFNLLFKLLLSTCTFLLNIACSESKLPKYVELKDLRVLSLVADKPEVNPGSSVTVTPIISDINETSSLNYIATGCIDPGVSLGAKATCENSSSKVTLAEGSINSSSNSEMAENFTGQAPSFSFSIPNSEVIFSSRSAQDQFNGVAYLLTYEVNNTRGEKVSAYRRILVSNKSSDAKNLNPVVNQIFSQGNALSANAYPLNGIYTLSLGIDNNSFQSYEVQLTNGDIETRVEELTTTWFITDGSVKYFRSSQLDSNEFTAPETLPSTRKSFLISVTRDSRGGIAIKRICGGCN